MNKKDIELYEFEMHLIEEMFCLRSNLSNYDSILPKGKVWKRVWKLTLLGLK